jgi:hypothetical protein
MTVVAIILFAVAVPYLLAATYLFALAVLAKELPEKPAKAPSVKFDLIVPAHNEEGGIAVTIKSLSTVDYPAQLRRVVVVADNCTDQTAAKATEAGARVLVRQNAQLRGKGYALAHAFEWSRQDGFASAVVRRGHRRLRESADRLRGSRFERRAGDSGPLRRPKPRGLLAHAPDEHRAGPVQPPALAGARAAWRVERPSGERHVLHA